VADLLKFIESGTISGTIARTVYEEMRATGGDPETIIKEKSLVQVSDTEELTQVVRKVLDDNPAEVEKFLGGKTKLMGFFVGQVMKATKGKGNPTVINRLVAEELDKRGGD